MVRSRSRVSNPSIVLSGSLRAFPAITLMLLLPFSFLIRPIPDPIWIYYIV